MIKPNVSLESGYVRRHLLNKERFNLWECPEELWMRIDEEYLGSMWRDLSATPPARILQAILKAFLQAKTKHAIGQEDWGTLVENIRKRRGDDLMKSGSNKEGRMYEELKTDAQNEYDSRLPVKMWDKRAWEY